MNACRKINPEFCISIEGAWDQMLQYSSVSWVWHSTWDRDHVSAYKYTFPEWVPCLSVSQPYDYNIVNNAMRFGYQLFVGPAHYTNSMDHKPMRPFGKYIKEALRIRNELKDTIYLGQFIDNLQVTVEKHVDINYSTHFNPKTGKRVCISLFYLIMLL